MSDKQQGAIIGGEFFSLEELKKKSENAVVLCEKIGVGAPAWPYRAILALLDHIEAQQGERQAFVAGGKFAYLDITGYELAEGTPDAKALESQAAQRYPAARPQVTREQVEEVIQQRVWCSTCGPKEDVVGADKAADAIMALIGGQNGD